MMSIPGTSGSPRRLRVRSACVFLIFGTVLIMAWESMRAILFPRLPQLTAADFAQVPTAPAAGAALAPPDSSDNVAANADGTPLEKEVVKYAVNLLEAKPVKHHPVMARVPLSPVKYDEKYVVEPGPLFVPAHFDCVNIGQSFWGEYEYFKTVPSRWTACEQHLSDKRTGVPWIVPKLPVVDEEYMEHVAVFDSVYRADDTKFVMAEIGARWGTWGFRAGALLKTIKPNLPYTLWFVEANPKQCEGIPIIGKKNDIKYTMVCGRTTADSLHKWMLSEEKIDLIDLDIQGAESQVLKDGNVMKLLDERVKRLIIGTHSDDIHAEMKQKFKHWTLQMNVERTRDLACVDTYFRSEHHEDRAKYQTLISKGCYHDSPFGKIANADGELIFDNPRFRKGGDERLFGDNLTRR